MPMDPLIQILKLATVLAGLAGTIIRFVSKTPSGARKKDDRPRPQARKRSILKTALPDATVAGIRWL